MDRLIVTVARGSAKYREMALGLGRSMRLVGETVPTAIITDIDADWSCFDHVIRPHRGRSALDKVLGLELTKAGQIIAVDCDALVFRPLSEIFEHCHGLPFAVQGDYQSNGRWHGADVAELCRRLKRFSIPRFNGGFVYYERTPRTIRLIEEMKAVEENYGSSGFEAFRGNPSEEVCILLAMLRASVGTVIPDSTDFMSTGVGLTGRLKMNIAEGECEYLCRRERLRYVRPHIFHASRYSNFLIYWRQLATLRRLFAEAPTPVPGPDKVFARLAAPTQEAGQNQKRRPYVD